MGVNHDARRCQVCGDRQGSGKSGLGQLPREEQGIDSGKAASGCNRRDSIKSRTAIQNVSKDLQKKRGKTDPGQAHTREGTWMTG